jgi:hypothetical protein
MTPPPRRLVRALALVLAGGVLALLPAPAHAVDPVAGAQTSGDTQFPNVGNGGYDVSNYGISMVWTPATVPGVTTDQSIVATTTITAATTGAPLSSFSLDFEGLTVDSVTVNGTAATHTRVQIGAPTTKYKLIVTPATPVSGAFTTVVNYHGTPVAHTDADNSKEGWNATSDGATFLNQPVGSMTGFPNNNTPADKATYNISVNIPSTISGGASAVASNGTLVSNVASAGRTTWVWNVAKPMASELSLISIGRYNMSTSDIVLANGLGTVKEWSFVDPTTSASSSFATTRAKIKPNLDFLSARYGTYPANATGIVVDNVTGLGINYALETQDRPFFPGSVGDSTLTHELTHQWFGDNVSPSFWSDLWLNEGPATYAESQRANEATTETTFYNQWSTSSATSTTWTVPAANPTDTDSSDLFASHVYARGAMALEALRTVVGPTKFLEIMKEWQVRYATTSRGTEDFFALSEELSGKELTDFFTDWIYEGNKPAWPGKFNLSIASTPSSGSVAAGAPFSYTLSAANSGKVTLTGKVVKLDLADVLDDATIGALPANTSLDGTMLTWNIPSTNTAATSTAVIPLTVKGDTTGGSLAAVASVPSTTLGGFCTTCTSTLSAGAGLPPVSPAADPTITGTPKVGETLTAHTSGWAVDTTFGYVWKRNGATIPGAISQTYPLFAADLGAAITVEVTGGKPGFADVTRTSAPTPAIIAGDQILTPKPTITGTPKVGSTLTAVPGTWDAGVTKTYQWAADGTDIGAATATTYTPVVGDLGKTITVTVTGTKAGFTTVTETSDPTEAVATGDQVSTPTPAVTGTVRVGQTLTADAGAWDAGVTKTYQWSADGSPIAGATTPTYGLVPGDLGKRITVTVTGTKSGVSTVSRTSAQTAPVAKGKLPKGPVPTITGKAKVGKRLTVVPGSYPSDIVLSFQWYVGTTPVPGATATKFKLKKAYRGERISVKVIGTKPGYQSRRTKSIRTLPVV